MTGEAIFSIGDRVISSPLTSQFQNTRSNSEAAGCVGCAPAMDTLETSAVKGDPNHGVRGAATTNRRSYPLDDRSRALISSPVTPNS